MKKILILIMMITALTACDALANMGDSSQANDDTSVVDVNSETDASDADMADGDMTDSDMADSDMADADMADADMADADMTDADMADTDMADAEMADDMASDYNGPDWAHIELVDARNGETFTLADFAGKTVYVEPMATWCTNCRAQLRRVRDAMPQLNSDEYVFIGISVESGLANSALADYTQAQEFDWPFAVAPDDFLQQLVAQYGRSITTPPSTPHFIIGQMAPSVT